MTSRTTTKRKRVRRKPAVPSMVVLRRKMALYQNGITQTMVADEVGRVTGTKGVSRQAVSRVADGHMRSRRIEAAFASLCLTTPERLGWPHKREAMIRARAAAEKQSA